LLAKKFAAAALIDRLEGPAEGVVVVSSLRTSLRFEEVTRFEQQHEVWLKETLLSGLAAVAVEKEVLFADTEPLLGKEEAKKLPVWPIYYCNYYYYYYS
jgi:hypothetical protein